MLGLILAVAQASALATPAWGDPTNSTREVGALFVTLAIAATAGHVVYHHPERSELRRPALTLVCLALAQVTLGAFVIWSEKNVAINTAHVVVGALTLATSLVLTLRSHQVRFGRTAIALDRVEAHRLSSRVLEWAWVRWFSPIINSYAFLMLVGGRCSRPGASAACRGAEGRSSATSRSRRAASCPGSGGPSPVSATSRCCT